MPCCRTPYSRRRLRGNRTTRLPWTSVVIGISTGGPQALKYLIPQLPANFPVPVVIVLHMPIGFTELYARSLADVSRSAFQRPRKNDLLEPGMVLLAPSGYHLSLERREDGAVVTHLDLNPMDYPHRPAADVLFRSAAEVYGSRVLGVVMTGMGSDGTAGSAWIKAQGGRVFTEAEASCVVYGMPRAVTEAGLSDRTLPLEQNGRGLAGDGLVAKIMVVDDSNLSRRVSRKILEEAGHSVVDAEDGLAALESYFLEKPDVVLLDVTMKGMSGIEVLRRLRELNPQARVIILTADVQSSTRDMTENGGACGFVTKPIVSEQILQAVDAALRGVTPCN